MDVAVAKIEPPPPFQNNFNMQTSYSAFVRFEEYSFQVGSMSTYTHMMSYI